ncbi:Protein kinase-like domain containing protein [Naviculisporaceae sp. PSN 640]
MELTIPEDDYSATRLRAIKDAIEMQDLAVRQCFDAGIETPPYKLTELIGKGSFGRVYKATATKLGRTVAVKIMSIEEGDCLAPGQSDTFAEIMKEVTTLRILGDGGAKNINKIIDSLLVGHSMWVVTEYCAGGSVATLMRPAGCLPESCIIPILREVAEAIYWVHKHGIIHRDLKCANVLITEEGGVQLCDFGVAGIVRSKLDKRSTITGTLQWMAPELFDSNVAYGNEVDIWAFGSMAYEAATGFPPNATTLLDMDLNRFGAYLRESCPRLEGDGYSDQLKDLISYCMVPDPAKRPRIEDVQKHPYLFDTATSFPTSSLKALVESYKKWEKKGGNRQSLFVPGGAQCHAGELSDPMDVKEWDYGTMDEADQFIFDHDQTGASSSLTKARPPLTRGQRRRRRLPANIRAVKSPLERVFDPNTLSNYQDQVKAFYKRSQAAAASPSVPLPTHEGALPPSDAVTLPITPDNDLDTIKPPNRQSLSVDPGACPQLQPQLGTSRTQDWTFPSMTPTPTSDPNGQHSRTNSTTSTGSRRTRHRSSSSTFSIGGMDVAVSTSSQIGESPFPRRQHRADSSISSRISLIDLDASIVPFTPPNITINSGADEFPPSSHNRYTESFPEFSSPPTNGTSLPPLQSSPFLPPLSFEGLDSDLYSSFEGPGLGNMNGVEVGKGDYFGRTFTSGPALPEPPRADVMMGMASKEALKDELTRLLGSMADHLKHSGDLVMGLPAVGPPKLPKVANGNVVGPVGSGASVGRGSDSAPKKEA